METVMIFTAGLMLSIFSLATVVALIALIFIRKAKSKYSLKFYSLNLYEIEALDVYRCLKANKPHLRRVEDALEEIFLNNPEFRKWDEIIEVIRNESNR